MRAITLLISKTATDELIQMNDNKVEISTAFDEDDKWKEGSSFVYHLPFALR